MPADEKPQSERPPEEDEAPEGSEDDDGLAFPAPFAPDKDDDSPLGDTDQHSDA